MEIMLMVGIGVYEWWKLNKFMFINLFLEFFCFNILDLII